MTNAEQYDIMAQNQFDVYSIDTKVINIDKTYNLVKRTDTPLSLHAAVSKAREYEDQGHVIELRKVS